MVDLTLWGRTPIAAVPGDFIVYNKVRLATFQDQLVLNSTNKHEDSALA